MKRNLHVLAAGLGAAVLVACTPASQPPAPAPTTASASTVADAGLTRADTQGAVSFEVAPLNLDPTAATLDFTVVMSTHSVDLSWNLAALATLSTDTGMQVTGASWPVNSGHHVEGTLSFPAYMGDGRKLLSGVRTLTLTIRDTDVPTRTFIWDLAR